MGVILEGVVGTLSNDTRFLVGKHAKGCYRVCKEVKSMLEALPKYPSIKKDLNPIACPWPFTQLGLDIMGIFPWAIGNRRFSIVTIDYFTKWVKAEALANI